MSASAAYVGTIRHRRFEAVEHEFSYPIFYPYLDLDEIDSVLGATRLWSASRRAPARFVRSDFMGDPKVSLADAARDTVALHAGERPAGPVRMLANLRYLGHVFNPVSFYFCFDEDERLRAVAADVTNTPWGESHAYAVAGQGPVLKARVEKSFHVSPFMGMDHAYEWKVTEPGERLVVHIESHRAGALAFDATLSLRRRELTRGILDRLLLRRPAMGLRVLTGIYGQALRLKLKGAPYFAHPERAAR